MATSPNLRSHLLATWRTNDRITTALVDALRPPLWNAAVPAVPTRSVRAIAAHLHNARCWWIKMLGREHGIAIPARVNHRTATRRQVTGALKRSGRGVEALLSLGLDHGGVLPRSKGYVWRNLPLDVPHVLAYVVAHEAHHRGQIVMVARQLNQRLPREVVNNLWWWAGKKSD